MAYASFTISIVYGPRPPRVNRSMDAIAREPCRSGQRDGCFVVIRREVAGGDCGDGHVGQVGDAGQHGAEGDVRRVTAGGDADQGLPWGEPGGVPEEPFLADGGLRDEVEVHRVEA